MRHLVPDLVVRLTLRSLEIVRGLLLELAVTHHLGFGLFVELGLALQTQCLLALQGRQLCPAALGKAMTASF